MDKRRSIWIGILASIFFIACAGTVPSTIGFQNGKFAPCPDKPNCVSSFEKKEEHAILPIEFTGDGQEAMKKIEAVILKHERAKIVSKTETYLHGEYKSLIFRFVDDVEILLDKSKSILNIKSASRKGYSDLGVNRDRVEQIRKDFLDN